MKHTTALVAALGLAATVSAANPATDNRRHAVNRRSVPVSTPENTKRDTAHQQRNKRVKSRSPTRFANPFTGDEEPGVEVEPSVEDKESREDESSSYGLKDQATDAAWDVGSSYLEGKTGIKLPDRLRSGSGINFAKRNKKRSVIEARAKSRSGGGKSNGGGFGGQLVDAGKDFAVEEGTAFVEDQTGIDLPNRNGQSSSGSSGGSWTSWRPWKLSKREITVDEVVEEVLDQMKEGESKSDAETADALREIVEEAAKDDEDKSISDVVEALAEASDDNDSEPKEESTDTIEEILGDSSDKEDEDEDILAETIEDIVDGDSSDSKSSHGDTLEEKLEELEKETSALDKDDPKAEMIDELIDELIDEAATLDEIPVEYFQYWMAVQSCLDPVHLLTTKGLMASHLSRRGTTPIIVTPTKTVKREEAKAAEVNLGLAQPFGAEMAQTSGAGDGLLGRGTVGYLVFGVAAAFLVRGVAF